MTVGQRIAQKRKELGLSQEGLGERLGVSRQAIYKWESDAALPEIEKLVNLSREFSVPVGWLLGEEDDAPEKPELTPEQLRMVEEIVGRYLDARPARETAPEGNSFGETAKPPRKKRRWPYVLAAVGVVVLLSKLTSLTSQVDSLRKESYALQSAVNNINSDVSWQIDSIASRVEEILQSQNTLTAEQSAEVADTDYRANTVTVSARAVPRTYVEGMTAEFIMVSEGETITVPGKLGESHAFTAQLTGPLTDSISVSVAFLTGNQRETQLLEQFFNLYSVSFPNLAAMDDLGGFSAKIKEYADVYIPEEGAARISSIRLGLFRDRKLLAWYEHLDEQPSAYLGDWPDTEFFRLDGDWTMEPGHRYCNAAVVVDEYGRERVYPSMEAVYDPEKELADLVDVDTYRSFDDPVNWDY